MFTPKDDLISCDECQANIVCGDEYESGDETLCVICFSHVYANEQDQTALCLEMEQQS